MSNKRLIAGVGIGLFSLCAWLFLSKDNTPILPKLVDKNSSKVVDYKIDDFSTTLFNQQGNASQAIAGKQLIHYPQDDTLKITKPIATISTKTDATQRWVISAEQAQVAKQFSSIIWQGNVRVKANKSTQFNTELSTNEMHQNTQTNRLHSNLPTQIQYGNGTITAKRFTMNLDTLELTLQEGVNSVYLP